MKNNSNKSKQNGTDPKNIVNTMIEEQEDKLVFAIWDYLEFLINFLEKEDESAVKLANDVALSACLQYFTGQERLV